MSLTIKDGVRAISDLGGVDADSLCGSVTPRAIMVESYLSRGAGVANLAAREGQQIEADRHLVIVSPPRSSGEHPKVLVHGKVSTPYGLAIHADGPLDLRPTKATVYNIGPDGIRETDLGTEQSNVYTGEAGKLRTLLPAIRGTLGTKVDRKKYKG